jgi:hypothetical protein
VGVAPVTGDDCSNFFTAAEGAANFGDTSVATDDYEGSCEGGSTVPPSGPDQVWEYTVTQNGTLNVNMYTDAGSGGFPCTLYMRSTCTDSSSELDCDNAFSGDTCYISATVSDGDTVYIFADTNNPGVLGGWYMLDVYYP